jgi:hypothetical protein
MLTQIKLYKEETGKDPYIIVGSNHRFTSLPSFDYVEWLEKRDSEWLKRAAETSGAQPPHAPNTGMAGEAPQIKPCSHLEHCSCVRIEGKCRGARCCVYDPS